MAMRFLGLCRGDGKGYVKIGTDTKPEFINGNNRYARWFL